MLKPRKRRGRPKGTGKAKPKKVKTFTETYTGICKVCSGEVKVVMELSEGSNQTNKIEAWLKGSGTCSACGTYFPATTIIDLYEITGEATGYTGKPTNCKDYRKSRMTGLN